MNRRQFFKGLMSSCAAVAILPTVSLANSHETAWTVFNLERKMGDKILRLYCEYNARGERRHSKVEWRDAVLAA